MEYNTNYTVIYFTLNLFIFSYDSVLFFLYSHKNKLNNNFISKCQTNINILIFIKIYNNDIIMT